MMWQSNPIAVLLGISAAISFLGTGFAFWRRQVPGAIALGILMLSLTIWSLGYAWEVGSQNPVSALWSLRFQYVGILAIPPVGLVFVAFYTGLSHRITRRVFLLLCVEPLVTTLIIWTNHWHGWMWKNYIPGVETGFIQLDVTGSFSDTHLMPGPFFWFNVVYIYAILAVVLVLVFRALVNAPQVYKEQGWALVFATLAPWVCNLVSLVAPDWVGRLDLTPFAFTASGLICMASLFRGRLLGILPMAYTNVIENMRDAVFILDAEGKILRLNPAAETMLNQTAAHLLNRPASETFASFPELIEHLNDLQATDEIVWDRAGTRFEYDLRVSPLYATGKKITGRLILLRDITERKQAEATLRQSNAELERRIADRTDQLEQINLILRQVANRQSLLYQTLRSMSQTLDLELVTRDTLSMIVQLTRWKNVCLAIPSDPPTHWKLIAARGALEGEINIPYPMTAGIIGRTFRTGMTQVVDDTQADPDYLPTPGLERFLSELTIPVRRVARILAVLSFESYLSADFKLEDVELGESLAEAIALALDNTLLYANAQHELGERERTEQALWGANELLQKRQEELTALYTIGRSLASTLQLREIYRIIYNEIGLKLFNAANLIVALYDETTRMIRCDFCVADYSVIDPGVFPPLALKEGPVSETIRTRQPRIVDLETAYTQPNSEATEIGTGPSPKAGLYAPMVVGDQVIGVLQLQHYDAQAFKESDLELIGALASQAAIAIKNAQGHEQLQQELALRKRAEEELAVQRDFAVNVMNAMGNGLTVTNADGRFEFANPAYAKIVGLPIEQILGKRPADLTGTQEQETLMQARTARLSGQTTTYETRMRQPDGTSVPVLVTGVPRWRDGKVAGTIAATVDLTDRKQAELEREKLIQELETKNAELERFTYTVSHDLKSPLITIRGFLGFLEQDARAGNMERLQSDSNRIVEATDKMQHLLNDLLELSRIGRLINPPEKIPFGDLVHEALNLVEGRISARKVQIEIDPDLPYVYGDHLRLLEIMQNLIDNAVKFMRDGVEPRIRIGARNTQPVVFFVQDNGIGIDPKYHHRVFDLFTKLDPQSEGTGVGLALVKRIVQVHGGQIWIESEGPGHGTTFCFILPQAE